ncbi:MAG: MBL fold metallo-hydrolase [Acidimicrobiales bacterium]|nr:MBL fold metallo-hydrolase [Acidimicrobiales bacterium]
MAITHNRDFEPHYGKCVWVAPAIRRVVAQNPNAFTFTGTGVYLIGTGDVAVVDPGPSLPVHLDAIEACLLPGETITHILVTHTHTDHTAAVPDLATRTGAHTYGFGPHGPVSSDDPLERLDFSDHISPEEDAAFAAEWADLPEELKREGPDTTFVPEVVVGHEPADSKGVSGLLTAANWTVQVIHTPGHTSNHLCFRLLNDGTGKSALFTGDHVMGWATSVISPPDGDLFAYLASLERLLLGSDDYYLPTHGPVIDDPAPYVRSIIDHRNDRTEQIVDLLAGGTHRVVDLVPQMYADVDKRLWRAAGNSVYAHLLALAKEGRAEGANGTTAITASWHLT